jgi:hypothetical protein
MHPMTQLLRAHQIRSIAAYYPRKQEKTLILIVAQCH